MSNKPFPQQTQWPTITGYAYADFAAGFTDAQNVEHRRLLWRHSSSETQFEWCAKPKLYAAAGGNPAFYGPDTADTTGFWVRAEILRSGTDPVWVP